LLDLIVSKDWNGLFCIELLGSSSSPRGCHKGEGLGVVMKGLGMRPWPSGSDKVDLATAL
jgi:hypothetical protein